MSEPTVNMIDPSDIGGDSPSSAKCTGDGPCGNSSEYECSGYICGEEADNNDSSYTYPPTAPLPDNKDKIPKKCFLPEPNIGRPNPDIKKLLSAPDVIKEKTKPWMCILKVKPQRPTTVNPKL